MSESKTGKLLKIFCLLVLSATTGAGLRAQSLDARSPTPVRTNQIVGRINARDIGDARLTSHFFTFKGAPGDLLITIETRNLNGDVDIFTAGTLRPVLKVALYAELTSPVTKSIYLRQPEDLILRVEARSPNDDPGIYQVSFAGSFQAVAAAELRSDEVATALPATRRGKRVSSVGARLEETTPPPLTVSEAPTPEVSPPSTEDPPPVEPSAAEAPVEQKTEAVVEAPRPARRSTRGRTPSRRSAGARNLEPAPATTPSEESLKPAESEGSVKVAEAKTGDEEKREAATEITEAPIAPAKKSAKKSGSLTPEPAEPTEVTETAAAAPKTKSSTGRTRSAKRSPAAEAVAPAEPSIASSEELARTKLIIEMLDGTRVERFMNTIRRVDVESGQVVITLRDGNVERIRLARVVRMSIGQ